MLRLKLVIIPSAECYYWDRSDEINITEIYRIPVFKYGTKCACIHPCSTCVCTHVAIYQHDESYHLC